MCMAGGCRRPASVATRIIGDNSQTGQTTWLLAIQLLLHTYIIHIIYVMCYWIESLSIQPQTFPM